MKQTKKPLALLLALLLLLGFGASAMAQEAQLEWSYVQRPENIAIAYGEDVVLNVQVQAPQDVVALYWWTDASGNTIAHFPELRIAPNNPHYPQAKRPFEPAQPKPYRYHVSFVQANEQGEMVEVFRHTGSSVRVAVGPQREPTFWETLWFRFILEPWESAFMWTFASVLMSMGFLLPLVPFYFVYFLVKAYISAFTGRPMI